MNYYELAAKYARVNEGRVPLPTARDWRGSAKRLSFDKDALISYSTVVARYHSFGGRAICLIDSTYDHGFSVSTSSQLRKAKRKISAPIFIVPHIGEWAQAVRPLTEDEHRANVEHYVQLAYTAAATAERCYLNEWRVDNAYRVIRQSIENACRYARAFGIERWADDLIPSASLWVSDLERRVVEKRAKFNLPVNVAKRERARARRIAKIALGLEAA